MPSTQARCHNYVGFIDAVHPGQVCAVPTLKTDIIYRLWAHDYYRLWAHDYYRPTTTIGYGPTTYYRLWAHDML